MWSILCKVPRNTLNNPILDLALKKSRANVLPNRVDLQLAYLPELDQVVSEKLRSQLKEAFSVSVVCDGWSDKQLLAWLGVSVVFISQDWALVALHLDLIPLHEQATISVISSIINEVVSSWLMIP